MTTDEFDSRVSGATGNTVHLKKGGTLERPRRCEPRLDPHDAALQSQARVSCFTQRRRTEV